MNVQFSPFIFKKFLDDIQSLYELQKAQIDDTLHKYRAKLEVKPAVDYKPTLSDILGKKRQKKKFTSMLTTQSKELYLENGQSAVIVASQVSRSITIHTWAMVKGQSNDIIHRSSTINQFY